MQAQITQIIREYGSFNNETANMFNESGKSRLFRENYQFKYDKKDYK